MLAPVAWLVDAPLPALSTTQVLGYAYLSVIGALLSYALWFRCIERLSPEAVSSLGLLSPLTAVLLGWVLLGQAMTGWSLVGLVTVLVSVFVVQWAAGPRAQTRIPQGARWAPRRWPEIRSRRRLAPG